MAARLALTAAAAGMATAGAYCYMAQGPAQQQAFAFIKPHAVTPACEELVPKMFAASGIEVVADGVLSAKTIDENQLIDTHYGAIAKRAVVQKPSELVVPAKGQAGFKDMFGVDWNEAVSSGQVYNAKDACAKLGVDGAGLDALWGQLKRGENLIKFGGGFYCGKVNGIYVMNGFYMEMRTAYTTPGKSIHWYSVQFPEDKLSWGDFRGSVLGPTNPKDAPPSSVRGTIYSDWQKLGLAAQPDTGDNGVHASASPFEGLAERMNWLGAKIEDDSFGQAMLNAGVPKQTIIDWTSDPLVAGGSLFDALEDLDRTACLVKAVELVGK
jgi:nucleoside diphosphate kinase